MAGGGCSAAGTTASTARRWPSARRRHPRQNTRSRRLPTRPGDCPLPHRRTERIGPIAALRRQGGCRRSVKQAGAAARIRHQQPGSALCQSRGTITTAFFPAPGDGRVTFRWRSTAGVGNPHERLPVAVGPPKRPFRYRPTQALDGTSASLAAGPEADRPLPTHFCRSMGEERKAALPACNLSSSYSGQSAAIGSV